MGYPASYMLVSCLRVKGSLLGLELPWKEVSQVHVWPEN